MIAILSLLAAASASATPRPAPLETFADWTIGCDNIGACHAVALMPETMPEGATTMSIRREPHPSALPEISFGNDDAVGGQIEADGRRLAGRLVTGTDDPEIAPADVPAFVAALRSARTLRIVGRDGASLDAISLDGMSAALARMDERQHRTGTATALANPGMAPASPLTLAAPLPIVRAAAPTRAAPMAVGRARIRQLRRDHDCSIGEVGGPDEANLYALDDQRTLILLACGSGAYNVTHVPFIAERRGARVRIEPARFDVEWDWWEGGRPTLINAEWRPADGALTSYSKGRGLGDCGTISGYAWDGERFRLVEQMEMNECRGGYDYIRTWRAQLVRG